MPQQSISVAELGLLGPDPEHFRRWREEVLAKRGHEGWKEILLLKEFSSQKESFSDHHFNSLVLCRFCFSVFMNAPPNYIDGQLILAATTRHKHGQQSQPSQLPGSMDWPNKLLFAAFIILAAAIDTTHADAMVSGTVFCDQCKDGKISLFDYPVSGVKIEVECTDGNGQVVMKREETTNWVGNYDMKFDGAPDLSSCHARVSGSGQGSGGCGLAAGPAQSFRLMFSMFDMEMYTVDPLLSQPPQPTSYCTRSASPVPGPSHPYPGPSSPTPRPANPVPPPSNLTPRPPNPVPRPANPVPRPPNPTPRPVPRPVTPAPHFRLPPMPKLPPLPPMPKFPPLPPLPPMPRLPPMPFIEASACSHQNWSMPQYRCHWVGLNPDMKVAVIFGTLAGRRYGTNMTLRQGLQGRGDPYRTLLREGITALLNSYHSLLFQYHSLDVLQHFNWALMGSQRRALLTAQRFIRANSGSGNVPCKFNRCT